MGRRRPAVASGTCRVNNGAPPLPPTGDRRMALPQTLFRIAASFAAGLVAIAAAAADYPAPRDADWIARDFRFHTGEVMPELRIHFKTIGSPEGQPVLILH